jgi:hypothetical protein
MPPSDPHPEGVKILEGDGAAWFIKNPLNLNAWRALGTISGGRWSVSIRWRNASGAGAEHPRAAHAKSRGAVSILFALATAVALGAGCSVKERVAPADPARAREVLKTVLEAWKNGDPADKLQSASPPIVAQDLDWMAGHRLMAYEVSGDGKAVDANLRIPVKLTVRLKQGQEVTKDVAYLVSTNPSVTVFREF